MFRVYKEGEEEVKQKLEGSQDLNVEKDPKAARLAGHREEECCICIQHVIPSDRLLERLASITIRWFQF